MATKAIVREPETVDIVHIDVNTRKASVDKGVFDRYEFQAKEHCIIIFEKKEVFGRRTLELEAGQAKSLDLRNRKLTTQWWIFTDTLFQKMMASSMKDVIIRSESAPDPPVLPRH
jgi:hypothetical protein